MAAKAVRAGVALLTIALLGGTVAVTLLGHVPNIVERPLAQGMPRTRMMHVDLGAAHQPDGSRVARVGFRVAEAIRLAGHDEIRVFVSTYGTVPLLAAGAIRFEGTPCVFTARPGQRIPENEELPFEKGDGCGAEQLATATGRFDLELTFGRPGRVAVLTSLVPARAYDPNWPTFSAVEVGARETVPVLHGHVVDRLADPPRRRIDLLAYMWRGAEAPGAIWILVAVGTLLVGSGVVQLSATDNSSPTRTSIALGALALGLGVLYAAIVPPLQGPDEPDHVLTFAEAVNRPALGKDTEALSKRVHFDRIFQANERFRAADIGNPYPVAWDPRTIFSRDVAKRSVTTEWWWKSLAPLTSESDAGAAILTIRLANALLFGLLTGAAALLITIVARDVANGPHVVVAALLLVPTLPFFATHVSEFAVLTSLYVVVAAVTAGVFLDGQRSWALGLPLGLATSLVLASGRSALPFGAALAAVVFGRALIGSSHFQGSAGAARRFWGGLAVGLLVFPLLSSEEFRHGLWPDDVSMVPAQFKQSAVFLRQSPWMLVLLAPAGFACDRVMTAFRVRRAQERSPRAGIVWRGICGGAAAAVVGSLVLSLFVPFPSLVDLAQVRPASVEEYVGEVLTVAATGFRLWHHDRLMSLSFWGGFGWLDAGPPEWYVTAVVLMSAAAVVLLCVHQAGQGTRQRIMRLVVFAAGWGTALALYAVSVYFLNRNLHGRYLVGLYVSALAVAWCSAALVSWRRPSVPAWLGVIGRDRLVAIVAIGLHAYALRSILLRYF